MSFPKMKLKVIRYRNYKTFNNDAFVNSLRKELISQKKVLDFRFSEHCTKVLDKHVSDSIYHLTLKAVVKWRNHPSKRYNNIRTRKCA